MRTRLTFHLSLALIVAVMLSTLLYPAAPVWGAPPAPDLIATLRAQSGDQLHIAYHAGTGQVRFIGVAPDQAIQLPGVQAAEATATAVAMRFLESYGPLFGVQNPLQDLALSTSRTLADGRAFTRFQQTHQGLAVLGGELIIQTKGGAGVISANGELAPNVKLDVTPKLAAEQARQVAVAKVAKQYQRDPATLMVSEPALWVYNPVLLDDNARNINQLVWRMVVTDPNLLTINELLLVDAHTGMVALHVPQIEMARRRLIYDHANNSTLGLPGQTIVRSEGGAATGNRDVDLAYDHLGDTYDFFLRTHGWDSVDNAGMPLIATVRACPTEPCPYDNAFWNGEQMVLGAGWAAADDVVAHEMAHGVIDHTANLFYSFESGAINESLADLWGELVDQSNGRGNDSPAVRWLLGEDSPDGAVRNLRDPVQFEQPDRIGNFQYYYCGLVDNGGVHTNSGVNNKAIYLLAEGGAFNGFQITALGLPKVAALYFEAQTNLLTSGSDYEALADALLQASRNLGFSPGEQQAVQNTVAAVEMQRPPCGKPADPSLCPAGQAPALLFQDDMEDLTSGKWRSATLQGLNAWYYPPATNPYDFDATNAVSGVYNLWGYNQATTSDSYIAMTQDILLPSQARMAFQHSWSFDSWNGIDYDGGVVEYSQNGGSSWLDAEQLFQLTGYTGFISTLEGNPLGSRRAFVNTSRGYRTSQLDLRSLAGQSIRFRFRIGADKSVDDWGWFIDNVAIYSCAAGNSAPLLERLPDQTIPINQQADQLVDLWRYTVDAQDVDASLTYSITNTPVISAGVTLAANRYLSVKPLPGWSGATSVAIQVTDTGALTSTTTLQVIVSTASRLYLPVIARAAASVLPERLFAVEDALIEIPNPDKNYCRASVLWAGNRYRSLIKFNVSRIPTNARIQQAKLRLYLTDSYDIPGTVRQMAVYRVNTPWTSCAVTWKNQPGVAEEFFRLPIPFTGDEWFEFDITELVRAWVDGRVPNHGLWVYEASKPNLNPAYREFASLNSGIAPVIVMSYVGGTAAMVPSDDITDGEAAPPAMPDNLIETRPLCKDVTDPAQMCLRQGAQ